MMKLKVICNTSPIIGLMSIGRISLLWQLFDEVILPKAVVEELCTNSSRHQKEIADIQQYIVEGKITVYQVQNENIVRKLYGRLHYGELEVIIGAKECNVPLAVIDERTARKMAANFLVDTIGILGILSLAKKQGILKNIKSDIDMLRSSGYRISESLYRQILLQNNELI